MDSGEDSSTGRPGSIDSRTSSGARFRFSDRGDEIRLGLSDSTCVALDLKTGVARTNVTTAACGIPRQEAEPGFTNETEIKILPNTEQKSVTGLRVKDGAALWTASIALDDRAVFEQPPAITEPPVRNGIAPLVMLSYRDNPNQGYLNVRAFDAATGALRWRIDGKASSSGRYLLTDDGNGNAILVVSFSDETPAAGKTLINVLAGYSLADGAERWRLPWVAGRDFRIENGLLFGCASGGPMAWLDPATGRSLGQTRGAAADCNISNPNRSRLALSAAQRRRLERGRDWPPNRSAQHTRRARGVSDQIGVWREPRLGPAHCRLRSGGGRIQSRHERPPRPPVCARPRP